MSEQRIQYSLEETIDELLEALFMAREQGVETISTIEGLSKVPFDQEHHLLLLDRGLVYDEGERLSLTPAGESRAEAVIRRHRLTDVLLYYVLGMKDHEQRERVACITEHTLLPEMMEGICTLMGHPTNSPEGDPIPPGECCRRKTRTVNSAIVKLSSLSVGDRGRVAYIKPQNHARFERLISFGLIPGTLIALVMDSPAYVIRFENTELALDSSAMDDIYVTRLGNETPMPHPKGTQKESLLGRLSTWVFKGK